MKNIIPTIVYILMQKGSLLSMTSPVRLVYVYNTYDALIPGNKCLLCARGWGNNSRGFVMHETKPSARTTKLRLLMPHPSAPQ